MPDGISWKEALKLEKEKWKQMNGRQRISYFTTYYLKATILILVMLGAAISIAVTIAGNRRPVMISGAMVNLRMTEDGKKYLTEDLKAQWNGKKKERVLLETDLWIGFGEENYNEITYTNSMKLMTRISAADIDYLIVDENALANPLTVDGYANLKELLSEELLEQLDGKLIEAKTEDGAVYPVALELTDSSFAKRFELKPQPSYLVFLVNGRHIDRAENLISYLMTDE